MLIWFFECRMEKGRSKEELVIEEGLRISKGSSKLKWLIAIAVVLAVMMILFIGLYASEKRKLKDAENEIAAAKGSSITKGPPSTKAQPSTKAPRTTTPGTKVTADSVQVAASELIF